MELLKSKYKKMTIEELIILSQKNDFKALEELIKRQQKEVFLMFSYLCKGQERVFDLTQEALIRISKGISGLKNPKTFKSWVNQIVTHLFYDELRREHRRPQEISIDEFAHDTYKTNPYMKIPDKKHKPLEKCLSNELDKVIRCEIKQLPEQFRMAIILREMQGLSYEEIANITSSSTGTVKSRIARARSKLQEKLKKYL